ncbi:hypothetical protein AAG570_012213 [Ranatra chinensis]|uniref:Uncharacterized protein n=1 Tax=Ranatra chinensis TaxID=642074 RepID=A0ABD0YWM3_9HEMI
MLRRPWPPLYHVPAPVAYPSPPPPPPDYYYSTAVNKGREYYWMAPLYRDALPPPPQPARCTCSCVLRHRSRSLDTVRSEEYSDPEDRVEYPPPPRQLFTKRRSMEDLLDHRAVRKRREESVDWNIVRSGETHGPDEKKNWYNSNLFIRYFILPFFRQLEFRAL